jgi:hypothetical protein
MRANRGGRSWRWFVAWMTPGVCLAFTVTALGVFMLPVGLVLVVALAQRRPTVDAWGLLAGLGAIVAWIGSINLDHRACSSHAVRLSLTPAGSRSISYSCGGVNGLPWLVVGATAAIAAIVLYLLAARSRPPGGKPTGAPSLSG